ncbi:hypothetical protein [Prevotella sp.]|uniref:hypothetical protein n=1 Tax=Prevotella sp. TaxID=59823 RepID=UPI003DA6947D
MINLRKKYWYVILIVFFLLFPLLLNYFVTRNSVFDYKVAGKPSDWILFWVTYLSSIASLAMVVITWWTLKQNKIQNDSILKQNTNQLDELKRQWKEANTTYLSCSFVKLKNTCAIRIINSSNITASNVEVELENKSEINIPYFDETRKLLSQTRFVIPPHESKDIMFYIRPLSHNNYKGGIEVKITSDDKIFGPFLLDFKEINLVMQDNLVQLIDSISQIKK